MKKLFGLLMIAGMMSFVACGPTAEEIAEKARLDSIRVADSLAAIQAAEQARLDSIAKVEAEALQAAAEQAKADSIAAAEAAKGKKK